VNRRPDSPGQYAARIFSRHCALLFLLACALFFAAGCKKKPTPVSNVGIRNITREFVFAARNASGGRAEVGMRPEYAPRQPGKQQLLAADHIYITVPSTKAGAPDQAAHDAIDAELGRVAEFHHMQRVARPGAPGLERFDYLMDGRRTQSIHLITPLPKAEVARSSTGRPELAIVIDDLGNDRAQADSLFRLAYPLTISVLPHEANSGEIAEEAHRRGYQVMLHLPMATAAGNMEEAIELHPGMPSDAVERTFAGMLDTVPFAAGVNNHEGSLGTADQQLMDELMPLLHERNLFFIDSRTTTATVAETSARAAGVAAARRNVFMDDEQYVPAIRKQFELAIRDAREKGSALAIGHPHAETLEVLNEMLPQAERRGVRLVFASDLAR
jgi:polysaccharide deacetylase 2 family uncharacterized protein YibQ